MGALETIMDELYRVRCEVLTRRAFHKTPKFAVYYGRLAEMEMHSDPEIFRNMRWVKNDGPRFPLSIMGALLQADYGLPEYAVAIHVDGKPYTTISLQPPQEPSP